MARPEVGLGSKCGSRRAEGAEGGKRGHQPQDPASPEEDADVFRVARVR